MRKSYVINAIHITLSELNIEGGFFGTTGMAAVGIGGSTLHSRKSGLALPVKAETYTKFPKKLRAHLHNLHKEKKYIIIDEFSMLKQVELYYLIERLKEIMGNNRLFEGLAILMV